MKTIIFILFLVPYVLVPFFLARKFSNGRMKMWLTFLVTFSLTSIILCIWPFLFEWLNYALFPAPEKDPMCRFPMIFINIVLLPISLLLQILFNLTLRPNRETILPG